MVRSVPGFFTVIRTLPGRKDGLKKITNISGMWYQKAKVWMAISNEMPVYWWTISIVKRETAWMAALHSGCQRCFWITGSIDYYVFRKYLLTRSHWSHRYSKNRTVSKLESTAEFNPTKIRHVEFSPARSSRCLFRMLAHMKTGSCKLIIALFLLLVN